MKIKLLSDSTINRIAAGEVIERPASVVKELVENAIDASSTKIDISLQQAGKNLIIISDDGIGMSEEDLKIAVERHTTSKLDESDLQNIHTFGFRGEALPSICSVSKMLITSKARGADRAYHIQSSGGHNKEIKPTIHNEGTKIEIRDLFFATPARLKFLRSDKTELAASVDVIKKIALAHPKISINLSHDGKNIIKVKGQDGNFDDLLKQRIIDILGYDFIENSVHINLQRPEISVYGFTSLPTFNRASVEDQFLFVNNRPVKDKLLQIALRLAYQDYLARDRHPVSVLFLQIDPHMVDVNVHPAKTEVRFHDPSTIRGLLISSIKDALATRSHMVSTNIATTALGLFRNTATTNSFVKTNKAFQKNPTSSSNKVYSNDLENGDNKQGVSELGVHEVREYANTPQFCETNSSKQKSIYPNSLSISDNISTYKAQNLTIPRHNDSSNVQQQLIKTDPHAKVEVLEDDILDLDCNNKPLAKFTSTRESAGGLKPHPSSSTANSVTDSSLAPLPKLPAEVELCKKSNVVLGAAKAQMHGTYIISQTADSIIIVDQHAAHERLGYEKIKQMISNNGLIKQRLLMPEIVELPDVKRADLLYNKKDDLSKLGLSLEKFGERSIIVSETPSLLGNTDINQLTQDLADNLSDLGENISLIQLIEHVTETYACHYAIRAGHKLSSEEMNELLRQMEKTPFSGQCNHGRPTYIELKLKDIERLFGRR
ncbi:DNA mismatch repair endonuclease MutL [Candidatus Tisiphia endosymbiont of Melanophora roralis]|uniref:DNA mismatch repair endonuclease MutL n=1 Tax=Candidatus Tisiphia endosymbiont of Melanophora roralis TaxID=3066261 RepID=UPI00312C9CA8